MVSAVTTTTADQHALQSQASELEAGRGGKVGIPSFFWDSLASLENSGWLVSARRFRLCRFQSSRLTP